jgi:cytochrome bd-type quinol oxidase subunit 1
MGGGTVRVIASLIITAAFYVLAVTAWRLLTGWSVARFFRKATRRAHATLPGSELAPSPGALSDAPGAAL